MSLKARLRIAILGLVVSIVFVLTLMYIHSTVAESLSDALERAEITAQQVSTFVLARIPEQMAAHPQPASFEETKNLWYQIISTDKVLPRVLERTLTSSTFVIEVAVVDEKDRILAASNRTLAGKPFNDQRSFSDWKRNGVWTRLYDLLTSNSDYVLAVPVGVPQQNTPVLTIKCVVSTILLRQELIPDLRQILTVSVASLLLSILLAVLVSQVVGKSFEQLSQHIDNITRGDVSASEPYIASSELADVQTKLALLGQEYHGFRQDAIALKQNIDQMLQQLEEAVLVFDSKNMLRMGGKPVERLLAKPLPHLLGKRFDEIFPSWTGAGQALEQAFRTHRPIFDRPVTLERVNLPSARLLMTVEFVGAQNEGGGTLVTLRDAEGRRQIESQLSVSQRLSAISKLTSGLAHEIKNPLNAIGLHLEICRARSEASQPVAAELGVMTKELSRLDRVVKTFLEFVKPVEPKMQPNNLVELARDVVFVSDFEARKKGVSLEFRSEMPEAHVMADRELAQQAVSHIVRNALEAVPPSGVVRVAVWKHFDDYEIAVSDNGPGIPPELHDKIFNLYFTTKPNGSGVGLALAFLILQLHNGGIEFSSEPGKGAMFRLHFPPAPVPEAARKPAKELAG